MALTTVLCTNVLHCDRYGGPDNQLVVSNASKTSEYRYGGPDNQLVTDEFKIDWFTYLTSSENVIYAQVDGRGSGGRGTTFLHQIYRRFGTIEVQDQISAARYVYVHRRRQTGSTGFSSPPLRISSTDTETSP